MKNSAECGVRSAECGVRPKYRMHSGDAVWGTAYPVVLLIFGIVSALIMLFA